MDTPPMTPTLLPPKTSGLAIASLVLGILATASSCITGIPAIICGHVALSKIKKSGGAIKGSGLAIAGLVLGYVMSLLVFVFAGLAVPTAMKALEKAEEVTAINNARGIKSALDLYAADHSGAYPATLNDLVPTHILDLSDFNSIPLASGKKGKFIYVSGLTQTSPGDQIILYTPILKSGNRIVGRLDSSAAKISDTEARAELAAQGITAP